MTDRGLTEDQLEALLGKVEPKAGPSPVVQLETIFDQAGFPPVDDEPPAPLAEVVDLFSAPTVHAEDPSALPAEYLAARALLKAKIADRKTEKRR